jgi:hypothetical protein
VTSEQWFDVLSIPTRYPHPLSNTGRVFAD